MGALFHIVDTLETARAFRVRTQPRITGTALDASVDFDPYTANVDRLIDAWLPLTFAFNSTNRSMGLDELYPFVLGAPSMRKFDYIYNKIHRTAPSERQRYARPLKLWLPALKGVSPHLK